MNRLGQWLLGVLFGVAVGWGLCEWRLGAAPTPEVRLGVYIYDDVDGNWDRVRERDVERALAGSCALWAFDGYVTDEHEGGRL